MNIFYLIQEGLKLRMRMNIYTVGHSTHSIDDFLNILHHVQTEVLVDIRAFPSSRKFPQYNQEQFKKSLEIEDITYIHCPLLAGRRKKSQKIQEEINCGWENQSFHNYADYTLTTSFQKGIKQLTTIASTKTTTYCCAERHPSRCHRLLISNWLTAHNWNVHHLLPNSKTVVETVYHRLGKWGAMPIVEDDGTVVYPLQS